MIRVTTILILTFFTVSACFSQTVKNKKRTPSVYSNWISIDYLNCLKTDLPCDCEKFNEYFFISLESTKQFVLLYDGRANYDYNLYDFKTISSTDFEIFNKQYSQTLFRDTTAVIGHLEFTNDTLLFIDTSGKRTRFQKYSTGDKDGYYKEHIKLLNSALKVRDYESLNEILNSDSLKCFCNWELGGVNLIFSNQKNWILEKKDNQLYLYEWINPPSEKQIDLIIEKKLLKTF